MFTAFWNMLLARAGRNTYFAIGLLTGDGLNPVFIESESEIYPQVSNLILNPNLSFTLVLNFIFNKNAAFSLLT
jgi:hypothetical protein